MYDTVMTCAICGGGLDDGKETVQITEKGATGINNASDARGNTDFRVNSGQTLHSSCRLDYCNKKSIKSALKRKLEPNDDVPQTRTLRSQCEFTFPDHCLLCGNRIQRETNDDDVFMVRTEEFQVSLLKVCDQRNDDEWAKTIRGLVEFAGDLIAVEAIYHQVCSVNFRTGKHIPLRYRRDSHDIKPPMVGRRSDISREDAFLQVIDELRKHDDEQSTIYDLIERMSEICPDPYSQRHMRQKIREHLGDNVVITRIHGKANVVTFHTTASKILQTFHDCQPKMDDKDAEKQRIIKAATELIKTDIKSLETSKELYPDPVKLGELEQNLAYLPESLRCLLSDMFCGTSSDLKVATIGQCIMQATRPRVILAPIQFGLGVQMHHLYGSRFLIDSLSKHGLCSSYQEVLHFSKCAANVRESTHSISGHFGHYIADNVDHNLRTLDGRGTFHGMGIIVAVNPEVKRQVLVPRLPFADEGVTAAKIGISYYNALLGKGTLLYQTQPEIICDYSHANLDLLWKISWPLRPRRPGWSGMMQAVCTGEHPGKSSIHFLPMIDMDPTDMSCIYSTLLFVAEENRKHATTPVLTFDQPLWFKAKTIISNECEESDLKNVVLKLGAFHIMISYLGSIGHLMNSSGLREVLELIYADNAVTHILSGKAYARGVRAHTLVDAALNAMVVTEAYGITLPVAEECKTGDQQQEMDDLHPDLKETLGVLNGLIASDITVNDACSNAVFEKIHQTLNTQTSKLANSPTGQLWNQYMTMVALLRRFLTAERTGDFKLHLKSLQTMLPYLASSGHSHYTKSVYIYMQDMIDIEENNPNVYEHFLSVQFVIRRSDRFWSGLSTDLVIEQVLMRALKTTGGLTRGRGMEEAQRNRWLLSMPACAEVNEHMQHLTGAQYSTSEQHKEMTDSRKTRDDKDTREVFEFLQDRDPSNKLTLCVTL